MEQQAPPTSSPQVSDTPQPQPQQQPPSSQQQQQQQQQQQPQPPSSSSSSSPSPSSPNPSPNPKPPIAIPQSRPWQPSSHFSCLPSPSSTSSARSGGMAIGVPSPSPQPFSSSLAHHHFNASTSSISSHSHPQMRPSTPSPSPMQGMGMGMMGSSSQTQMRPAGIPAHLLQRPSLRPPASPTNHSPAPQNFQGHGLLRGSSSPASPSPNTPQGMHSINQPWLSSNGKPPLPSPSYRPQINPQSSQQRSHIPRSITQQLHLSSAQAQPSSPLPPHQQQEHYGQLPPSTVAQSLPHQQQISRVQGSGNQKPSSLATMHPTAVQPGTLNRIATAEKDESSNRILTKRSIHDLVSQIDPLEKLDPDVEDILVDIAEDFIDSITTFGCSLAKHRKSNMLEAKDILLHLERNWNISLPGFGGDEIKSYRKPPTNDIHRERLSVIKRSAAASEMVNSKNSAGQGAGNAKSNLAKTPANTFGSSNVKMREAT